MAMDLNMLGEENSRHLIRIKPNVSTYRITVVPVGKDGEASLLLYLIKEAQCNAC